VPHRSHRPTLSFVDQTTFNSTVICLWACNSFPRLFWNM